MIMVSSVSEMKMNLTIPSEDEPKMKMALPNISSRLMAVLVVLIITLMVTCKLLSLSLSL
jgi:hypothetical protein